MSKHPKLKQSILNKELLLTAIKDSFKKLSPIALFKSNPVMFAVETICFFSTGVLIAGLFVSQKESTGFVLQITIWLWFTVLFANFSEAVAEGKGKAQAESLKKAKSNIKAKLLKAQNETKYVMVEPSKLGIGSIVLAETGDFIPADGDVIEGMASIDESAITGESEPAIRESGGDRCAVTAGTRVISDWVKIKITSGPGESFIDKMIKLVEGAQRKKTPNELALNILLFGFTLIFIVVCCAVEGFAYFTGFNIPVLFIMALFITLIPTTIAGLLSAIGISGMDRLLQANILAKSGRAVEAAGDIDTLLLDKTGTITIGNRFASEFVPVKGVEVKTLAEASLLSSLSDETPEGRSIVSLAIEKHNLKKEAYNITDAEFIPFSAYTRISGINYKDSEIRKGAVESIKSLAKNAGVEIPSDLDTIVKEISMKGGTPLAVLKNNKPLGAIYLKDVIKPGIRDRFTELRKMGIKTVMITGDNELTAAAIAAEAGVDDYVSQATPEQKLEYIRKEQFEGKMVAMCGDGTNDAPALAQSDVGVAMATGTTAAREAGNMVDLDSDPTKLIEVVKIGKQLLITRGSLTTFSITNDLAKYFAIIPALFAASYPGLQALNIMHLHSPQSAILSAIIFNALIIVFLIPMALKGVKYKPITAAAALRKNLLIYGVGGIIVPFAGVKLIDLIICFTGLVS
ncbi:MAG TPA: K(+)-transporting ATPase subunit B [Lentisphaeria bacterium]|nr:MAG: potassium-transporting ATPase subunit B [Lentisphaerae bacterium GWF2_38_69]HBM14826.1 K(+)-transporting ATPase subunit B [Lentisphaeria bacterium]